MMFMIQRSLRLLSNVLRQRRGLTVLPRMLTYTVTFGCNARCIMCDSWKMPARNELTLDDLKRVFAQLPRLDAVRLTGGEPFVRRDLGDIADLTVQRLRPLVLHVTTNGFLTDRVVRFCEQRDRGTKLHLLVSVDGVGEKHNRVRGSGLAWKSVMETLQTIAPMQRRWNVRLAVNQTIVDAEGADHYRQLREILRPLGVANQIVLAYDTSATYNVETEVDVAPRQIGQFTTFGEFTPASLMTLLDEAERDTDSLPWFERIAKRYYLRGVRHRLLQGRGTPNPPCIALQSHLRIFPNGDVPTCQFNSRIVGNLREQSFAEVWQSAVAAEQRGWVRRCPGCWAECEVLPNAVYTLDLLRTPKRDAVDSRPVNGR
ncbi:MAG: radical SAM protein [Pirellulaceae bacterium]|nr:radical SAM protein [Pirellulaceae bacterium]